MSNSSILPTVVSSDSIAAAQAALLANLQSTNTAVQACPALQNSTSTTGINSTTPSSTFSQASIYLQQWQTFYSAATTFCQQTPGWFSLGLGAMMDQVESYQNQLYNWQKIFQQVGCTSIVLNNPNLPSPTRDSLLNIAQWLGYGIVAAAGAYAVGKIVEVIVPIETATIGARKAREHVTRAGRTAERYIRRASR